MKKENKILQQLINDINELDDLEIDLIALNGYNDKYFGKEYKGSCILSGHPTHDVFFGIFYITTSMEFFIHLTDKRSEYSKNFTKQIKADTVSIWLQSKMIEVAKSGRTQSLDKDLTLKGLKAEI